MRHIHGIILLSPPPDLLYEIISAFDSLIIVYQYGITVLINY